MTDRIKEWYNRDEIIKRTGCGWGWIRYWFFGKSEGEILQECNRVWPTNDNEVLAASINYELSRH